MAETDLIKTEDVERATQVDAARTDTKHLLALQSILRKHDANCHGGRKCWRDHYGDQVQGTQHHMTCIVSSLYL